MTVNRCPDCYWDGDFCVK